MRNLLSSNAKLEKSNRHDKAYYVAGLALAPARIGGHGNVCPSSTAGCRASCVLWFAGRTVTQSVRNAAIQRTEALATDRAAFLEQLHAELGKHAKRAAKLGAVPVVRLNVASDLDWRAVAAAHPGVVFYDYTKVRSRVVDYLEGRYPANYHLTYSYSERDAADESFAASVLERGGNVAVVTQVEYNPQQHRIGAMPALTTIGGRAWPTVDGDQSDLRLSYLDGRGVVVGLRLKGMSKAKSNAIRTGFAIKH